MALVTMDNGEDWQKPNVFGPEALQSLAARLEELEGGEWAGMVLTGKPFVFCAGADIDRFYGVSAEEAREGSRAGHELFARIQALPYPTLAAINGACLGGGVEIALHCDRRTIASAVRHFACPEVFLGLFPAWGGTQIVPRIAGVDAAIRFIVTNPLRQNRMLSAAEAQEMGLADAVLEPAEFLDDSIAYLLEQPCPGARHQDMAGADEAVAKARRQLDDSLHGAAPAPYVAVDLIEGATRWSLEEGYEAEEEAIAELLPGRQAQASLYSFDLVERRAKKDVGKPGAEARPIRKVGIVGAGLMASQLATLFLRRLEVPIAIRDLDHEIVDRAVASIHAELESQVQKGRYDEGKARFLGSLVEGGTTYDHFADCDLVLEAVFEEMSVKQQVFAELEAVVSPETILATNTSSLSVAEMAANLERPERVVGLHFFNPVAVLPLVEIIRTPETDDASLATAWEIAKKLRKRPGPRQGRTRLRRQPRPDPDDHCPDGGARAGQHGRGDGRGDPAARDADGAVRPAPDGRTARRKPRPAYAQRGLPRQVPPLSDPGQLRRRQGRDRGAGRQQAQRRGDPAGRARGYRGRDPAHA